MQTHDTPSAVREASIVESIKQFALESPAVVAVYVFGSFGTPYFSSESDVDVAILFTRPQTPDHLSLMELKFQLERRTGMHIDLVCLNDASPVIGMQVLKKGKKIVDKNSTLTNEFFVRTVNFYADLKIIRRPIEEKIFREVAHGRS